MVAQQVLVLFVVVRIRVGQLNKIAIICYLDDCDFFPILLLKKLAKFIDNTKNFCNFVLGNHSDIL